MRQMGRALRARRFTPRPATYNLARMNIPLHGVKDTEFDIVHSETLLNEWHTVRDQNPAKKPCFDARVANPPFSDKL